MLSLSRISPRALTRVVLCGLMLLTTVACSSVSKGPGGQVSKVKQYHLIPGERIEASDPSIIFERQYLLHGAVTGAQIQERAGNYFAFQWKVKDRSQPLVAKFQYLQANTGLTVHSLSQEITDVGRNNWTKFQITGPAYRVNGKVLAWKFTLERGGQVLASQQSYLWE